MHYLVIIKYKLHSQAYDECDKVIEYCIKITLVIARKYQI